MPRQPVRRTQTTPPSASAPVPTSEPRNTPPSSQTSSPRAAPSRIRNQPPTAPAPTPIPCTASPPTPATNSNPSRTPQRKDPGPLASESSRAPAGSTPRNSTADKSNPQPSVPSPPTPQSTSPHLPVNVSSPERPSSSSRAPSSSHVVVNDPDIMEVAPEDTPRPMVHIQPFTISDYDFMGGYAPFDAICLPDYSSREINRSHVEFLKNLFLTKTFNPISGALVVAQQHEGVNAIRFDKHKMLEGNCILVDGRHRLEAVREFYIDDKKRWAQFWKRVPIVCAERRDGNIITSLEILALSAYFNSLSSAVLKVSFFDHIHAAIQTAKVVASYNTCDVGVLSIGELLKQLKDQRTLGDIDERQLRRYACVAHKLAQNSDFYDSLKRICSSNTGIGLVHLNSPALLSINDLNLWDLSLSSLQNLVVSGVRGSFEHMHICFYGCIKLLFGVVQKTATYKEMDAAKLLDSQLYITAHNSKSVYEYIADTMSRYGLVENQDQADNTRACNLKKKLVKLLGEDVEPNEPAEGSAKPKSAKQISVSNRGVAGGTQPRLRSTRKRKAVQESDEEDDEDVRRTRRKKKKSTAKRATRQPSTQQGPPVSETIVSTFLRAMKPQDLTRLMGSLGVRVIPRQHGSSTPMIARATDNMALESALPLEVLPGFYDSFDDSLPGTLPEAYADPPPYKGPNNPSWTRFLTKLPSKWPRNNPIAHITPWLEAMHIPHEHRAHSVITSSDVLLRNHHTVYYRAAHSYYRRRPARELPDVSSRYSQASSMHEKLWGAAVIEDEAALEFFGEKKEQLATEGFCILEGFLDDAQISDMIRNVKFPGSHPFFKSLESEALASFPGEESLTDPTVRSAWNIMQNVSTSVDSRAVAQGQGRFRMTNFGILERLESDPDKVWTIAGRAFIDIRIAQCVAALKLTKPGSTRFFMPRTGGRWILTSQECQRQALHTEFKALTRHETLRDNKCPGYFTVATGEQEVPIWVCSHSHRLAATSSTSKIRAASSASPAHIVRIPPFSVFVGRGDLYYSGVATSDAVGKNRSLYYHTYFVPEDEIIPIILAGNPHFQPRFIANFDEESEEESDKLSQLPMPAGSVKRPLTRVSSDDEYHTDEIAESSERDAGSLSNDGENNDDDADNNPDNDMDGGDNIEDKSNHTDESSDIDFAEYI